MSCSGQMFFIDLSNIIKRLHHPNFRSKPLQVYYWLHEKNIKHSTCEL